MSDARYEDIPIKLPLSVTVVGRLGRIIDREWPGAVVLTEHDHGPDHMVIRVKLSDGVDWEFWEGDDDG